MFFKKDSTEEDSFEAEIKSAKSKMELSVEQAVKGHVNKLEAEHGENLELKKRLSKFAQDHQLDLALIALWDAIEHYPTWSKREDFSKHNKLNVSDISEQKVEDTQFVNFSFRDTKYKISERQSYVMDSTHAYFSLFENDEEVFSIDCSVHFNEYRSDIRCFGISAFRKKGNWAKDLLALHELIKIEQEKLSVGLKYFRADDIKAKFSE